MPHPEPSADEAALLADFLTAQIMLATGTYPLPIVEAIAAREDARRDGNDAK